MKTRAFPNFFIIGAPKCGTTSLAAWLAEHPNIYMSPVKEPRYFSWDIKHRIVNTWEEYLVLFNEVCSRHKAVGEASVFYLFSRVAVPSIEKTLPDARYIVMVRNPVDMAYSWYEQNLRRFYEDAQDFQQAWYLAPKRRSGQHVPSSCPDPVLLDYPSWCRLGEQIERLYSLVPKERVLVLVLDDLRENPRREYLRALRFLGVPDDGRQDFPAHNLARIWRVRILAKSIRQFSCMITGVKKAMGIPVYRGLGIFRRLERLNEIVNVHQRSRPPLPPDFRAELEAFFEKDIQRLEHLLEREFPQWRSA